MNHRHDRDRALRLSSELYGQCHGQSNTDTGFRGKHTSLYGNSITRGLWKGKGGQWLAKTQGCKYVYISLLILQAFLLYSQTLFQIVHQNGFLSSASMQGQGTVKFNRLENLVRFLFWNGAATVQHIAYLTILATHLLLFYM